MYATTRATSLTFGQGMRMTTADYMHVSKQGKQRADRDGQGRSWTDKTLLLGAARPPRPPMKVAAYPGQGRTKSTKVLAELAEKAEKNLKRNSRMWPGNPWRVGLQCAGLQSPASPSPSSK